MTLDDYVDEFTFLVVSSKKMRLDVDGEAKDVAFAFCKFCPGDDKFKVVLEKTKNIRAAIEEHSGRGSHKGNIRAFEEAGELKDFLKAKKVEDPDEFQQKMLLSLMRDGLSPEFINGSFVSDFLAPRYPKFASLQSVDTQRKNMVKAYSRDEEVLASKLKKQLFWVGIDETPDSSNNPLVHWIATFIDGDIFDCRFVPKIERALIISETVNGKCGSEVILEMGRRHFPNLSLEFTQMLGLSSDSASYMTAVASLLAQEANAASSFITIHCPSHLIHDLMSEIVDWKENENDAEPWLKSALNFLSHAGTASRLRELAGAFEKVQKYSRIRWLTIGKSARRVYDQYEGFSTLPAAYSFTAPSSVPAAVRSLDEIVEADDILKSKLHLLAILSEIWGPTLTWFESNNPRAYECQGKLNEFRTLVTNWLDPQAMADLMGDLDPHRGVNGRIAALTATLTRLGTFVREKWQALSTNFTNSQVKFWSQMTIFNPTLKGARPRQDAFYFEILDRVALRLGLSREQRQILRLQFDSYLAELFDRVLNNSEEVWQYWVAARRHWGLLGPIVLILLACPIGNSELERSFSLVKAGSLNPTRQTATPANKSAMNKAHVNANCKFSSVGPVYLGGA